MTHHGSEKENVEFMKFPVKFGWLQETKNGDAEFSSDFTNEKVIKDYVAQKRKNHGIEIKKLLTDFEGNTSKSEP